VEETDWDGLTALIDYTHRILLRAAVWRRLARPASGPTVDVAVGFADMAGYTELTEGLDERELSELLAAFEALAYDTAAELNGRIVKTIGDEVMFVGFPRDVARIALALAARAAADPVVPDVRVGVASGTVLARDGDYYGPVVNLASRVTARARLGTVLTSSGFHAALADDPQFAWRRLGPKRVRGIGVVELFVLRSGE
jgi:adenylate cyclase